MSLEVAPAWEIDHERNGPFGSGPPGEGEQQLAVELQCFVLHVRAHGRPLGETRKQEAEQAGRIVEVPLPFGRIVADIIRDEGEVRNGPFCEDVIRADERSIEEVQLASLQNEARLGERDAPASQRSSR